MPFTVVTALAAAAAGSRPGPFFREDWRETPAARPITQEHVAHPELILTRHGPGEAKIKMSHHESSPPSVQSPKASLSP